MEQYPPEHQLYHTNFNTAHGHGGAGGNYQCLPNNPEYGRYAPGEQNQADMYGVEYQLDSGSPLPAIHDHNVPCAVCHVSTRAAVLMIPAWHHCCLASGHWSILDT